MDTGISFSVVVKPDQFLTDFYQLANDWRKQVDISICNPSELKAGPIEISSEDVIITKAPAVIVPNNAS